MPLDQRPGAPHALTASIPRAKDSDVEDVSWALSTAEAMWGRGDRPTPSNGCAARRKPPPKPRKTIGPSSSPKLRPISRSSSSAAAERRPQPRAPLHTERAGRQRRGDGPRAAADEGARQAVPAHAIRAHAAATPARRGSTSQPERRHTQRPQERARSRGARGAREHRSAQIAARSEAAAEHGRRRSKAPFDNPAPAEAPPMREDHTDTRTIHRPSAPRPPSSPPPSGRGTEPRTAEELESWPTQALAGDALSGLAEEMTRVSAPAFTEEMPAAPAPPPTATRSSVRPSTRPSHAPGARPSQAMRVVVWQSSDGVHVGPPGTRVAAPTIDALLVALDPGADLAGWLTRK